MAKGPSESLPESCCLEAEGAGGGWASGPRWLGSAGGWLVRDFSSTVLGGAEGSRSFKDFLEALGEKRNGGLKPIRQTESVLDVVLQKHNGVQRLNQQCSYWKQGVPVLPYHKCLPHIYAWCRIFSILG